MRSRRFSAILLLAALAALTALARADEPKAGSGRPGYLGMFYKNLPQGVTITFVLHGSPADIAGVNTLAVVETVDGQDVPDGQGLYNYLHAAKEGQTVIFGFREASGAKRTVNVTLGHRDPAALVKNALRDGARALAQRVAPGGDGWVRHQGPVSPTDLGSGITSLAVRALAQLPAELRKPHEPLIDRALGVLLGRARKTWWVTDENALAGQSYETYSTAQALIAVVARHGPKDPSVAFLASGLVARQLGTTTPWPGVVFSDLDWQWGGFPFEDRPILKRIDPRVTVCGTAIALEALHDAGHGPESPVMRRAREYLERVQNFDAAPDPLLKDIVDGGFPESGILSKAGPKDVKVKVDGELQDRRIYRSYGSATADGLASLIYVGADKARIDAATDWVRNHFELGRTPGFPADPANPRLRNPFEQGIRFYYVASLTRALEAVGQYPFNTAQGSTHWADAVLDTLLADQRRDGAWKNHMPVMDEDNEVIATSFALMALERTYVHLVK